MDNKRSLIVVLLVVLFISTEAIFVHAQSNGNGNDHGNDNNGEGKGSNGDGNVHGNDNNGEGKGNNNGHGNDNNNKKDNKNGKDKEKKPSKDKDMTHYKMLKELTPYGQQQAQCEAKGACYNKVLACPAQCPERKPKKNKKQKACRIDCSSKCEATCRWRKANCDGYGSLCYDPRFVGGDGVMFYFHGAKGGDFAIVSDDSLHINAHFIGSRPQGRTRDFTWVQALSVMFDTHTLVLAARRVSHWDDSVDALLVKWDGHEVQIPVDGDAEWKISTEDRDVVVERTDDTNNVRVKVSGLVEMAVRVRPIGEEENRVHNYQLPADDAFAHLETQFRFFNLSELVEGVLGKTYRPSYVSPVKRGVPMPMMGGEDKYKTPSFYSTVCNACRFQRPSGFSAI
ncbi:uncharacterized protein LOC127812473 [Diospyros lotus]|uniref:uncharacterized protein LOC127812473 n=1 Tax=Diospyros lotus TaxID=55363 RepID=UPI00225B0103|nr:uncharacterized protein LOC127812473 [Diospyros lotus]